MNGLIQEYCVGDTVEANRRCDVFSLLLEAREREGKLSMSDSEIMGNTFFVLWAGHETMSHIWDATVGLLALHDDIQEEMHAEIIQVALETDWSLVKILNLRLRHTQPKPMLRLFPKPVN